MECCKRKVNLWSSHSSISSTKSSGCMPRLSSSWRRDRCLGGRAFDVPRLPILTFLRVALLPKTSTKESNNTDKISQQLRDQRNEQTFHIPNPKP
jgi:hypothetical protein